jgi:hypothetical protein
VTIADGQFTVCVGGGAAYQWCPKGDLLILLLCRLIPVVWVDRKQQRLQYWMMIMTARILSVIIIIQYEAVLRFPMLSVHPDHSNHRLRIWGGLPIIQMDDWAL